MDHPWAIVFSGTADEEGRTGTSEKVEIKGGKLRTAVWAGWMYHVSSTVGPNHVKDGTPTE